MLDYLMNWVDENPEYNDVHVVRQIVVSVFGAIHTTTQVRCPVSLKGLAMDRLIVNIVQPI